MALEWGISGVEFDDLSYGEIIEQLEANMKRHERELKERAMFDYQQAQLNKFVQHKPNDMPSFDEAFPHFAEKPKEIEGEMLEEWEVLKMQMMAQMDAVERNRDET